MLVRQVVRALSKENRETCNEIRKSDLALATAMAMTGGMYETPIWGKKGWLTELKPDAAYDIDDLLPAMRNGLSVNGKLYAAPFYGESSMLMYRKDLADKAGVKVSDKPTWADSITFYIDLLKKYGPPGSSANSFNEILALYNAGRCGMWVDATIAASFITDPKQSKVADKVAFAQAPTGVTPKGANWLWARSLAIPAGTKKSAEAQKFVAWATSKEYIALVGKTNGWGRVPTGTRKSTYANAEFQKEAKFAAAEKAAIDSANPNDSTLPKSPYVGVQFAAIPEFQSIGITVGQQMSAALAGKITVDSALKASQLAAEREMKKDGYYTKK